MKKRIICVLLVFALMLVPFTVNAAYYSRTSSLSLRGNVPDNGGLMLLGAYDLQFTINSGANRVQYTFEIDPPQSSPANQAKSRLSYTVKRCNVSYSNAMALYNSSDMTGFYSFICDAEGLSFADLESVNGRLSTSGNYYSDYIDVSGNATNGNENTTNKIYRFEIEMDSMFRMLYAGDTSVDVLCGVSDGAYQNAVDAYYYNIVE